jgi:hypothetical protein
MLPNWLRRWRPRPNKSGAIGRVKAIPVDLRDQVEEVDEPFYRVYVWGRDGTSHEFEITGADIHEVLAWADRNVKGRTYPLWVAVPGRPDQGVSLVRLAGWDPPAGDLGRRLHAVTVPTPFRA